ncbi:MAG: hypothetical protein N3B13_05825 [Deltaproteobacteria bacterium]|nr:hypothetical protein [Deltaproteobacteria bacterium]
MIKKIFSLIISVVVFIALASCGIFDRVTAEVPIEFDIPVEFDITTALKVAGLDNLPDPLPPGIKRDDIVVPLPANLSASISDREEVKQYANKIYNVRIESLAFIVEENGFTQEIRPSVLGIARKGAESSLTAEENEIILLSTPPKINPDIESGMNLNCNSETETPETLSEYTFDGNGNYECEPDFDSEASSQCNIVPGGKDAPSEHLKQLEFTPKIMFCNPKKKILQEGILLYIDSDKYNKKPGGNIKLKIHLKIVLRVAPLD